MDFLSAWRQSARECGRMVDTAIRYEAGSAYGTDGARLDRRASFLNQEAGSDLRATGRTLRGDSRCRLE